MLEEMEALLFGKKTPDELLELNESDFESSVTSSSESNSDETFYFEETGDIDSTKAYFANLQNNGVDKFYQSIFRHLGVYDSLFEIIQGDSEIPIDSLSKAHFDLIDKIYYILSLACIDSPSNQAHFKDFVKDLVIPHIEKRTEIKGLSVFLLQYVIDNPFLLEDKDATRMATIILNKIEIIPLEDPSKTILLNCLIRMVSYKDFLIEDNQNKVLSLLTSNARSNILINFGDDNIGLIIDS